MYTSIKILGAVILSALIALAVTAAPAANRQESLPAQPFLATLMGADCSQLAWPNYETSCQFDVKRDGSAGGSFA